MQKKKIILKGILFALILIVGLFLYSEKINKVELVDNVKNVLSEQIQNAVNALIETEEITEVDVTDLEKGEGFEHEHLFKTMYNENEHWEECTVCGERNDVIEHSFERTWALEKESCEKTNYYTDACSCGYSTTGHKPCVLDGETTVTNGRYSISCTPEIEAGLKGRSFKAIVTDACENSVEQDFIIERIDIIPPTITTPDEVGGDWAKSKNFTFTAIDKGVGNVSIAFNDENDYKLATKDEENYSREYKFVGDAYEPKTAIVIYKDELGNISTKDIIVDKIDNTGPTITSANLKNNKLIVESNDTHPELGEGSGVVKYRYITSNKRIENPTITEEWKESNKESEIVIENVNEVKYIYVVAEDLVGNVGDVYELEVPALVLNTEVNIDAANGKGGVDLDWSTYDATDKIFKAYQKKEDQEGAEWESISTFDFYSKNMEPIKVLNVYPESNDIVTIPTVTFNYLDGTNESFPKSASLKVWMEGGTMTENGSTTTFNAYGKNPITGEQILKITPVSIIEFNSNPSVIWNYDIIMIGTWDANGGPNCSFNNDAIYAIEKYIQAGYGTLIGHDVLAGMEEIINVTKLRKYFNIEIGYVEHKGFGWSKPSNINEVDYDNIWSYLSSRVEVNRIGLLTNFPYKLPLGAKLEIPATHTISQAALGNVWMTLVDGTDNAWNFGSVNNYYNAGGTGNPCYYLTTWNNTAMIQTGHSNCESTDDERKVLANTLFYLKQRTTGKSFTDNSSQDLKAPDAPTINAEAEINKIKVDFNSSDNGSTYSFYVEAYDSNDSSVKLATSNQRTEKVTTGTKGYYYIIDDDSNNTDFDVKAEEVQYTTDTSVILDTSNNGKYIHMKAEDVAENVSDPSVTKLDVKLIDLEETISIELTKKWVDNEIQRLRRPERIKFIVTPYKEAKEEGIVTNEEVVLNESEISKEGIEKDNNIQNNAEEANTENVQEINNSEEVDSERTQEESRTENQIDKEDAIEKTEETAKTNENILKENNTIENTISNEIIKSRTTNRVSELINPKNLGLENKTTDVIQEEKAEDTNQVNEQENVELDKVQNATDTEKLETATNNEISTEDKETSAVDEINTEKTVQETSEASNVEDTTSPEGEKVEYYIFEYVENINKEESTQTYILELPKYDKETLEEIQYIITEEEVNPGDLKFYEATGGMVTKVTDETGNVKYTAEIVNTFKLPKDNVQSITVTKIWNDKNKTSTRPTSIILELLGRVENVEIAENTYSKEQSISSTNNWKHVFTGVPIYDENGQEIEYTIQEKADQKVLDRYIPEVSEINESNEIIVTNSLIVQDSKIEKIGPEEINAIDSKVSYNIDYTIELDNKYDENSTIEIVDTLPYQIDEEKSNLEGGIYSYNEETDVATITWTGTYNLIDKTVTLNSNTTENNTGVNESHVNVEVTEKEDRNVQVISIDFEIGIVYKDVQISTEKIVNKVTGKITLANEVTETVEDSFETTTKWVKDVTVNKMWKGDTEDTRPDSIGVELVSNKPTITTLEGAPVQTKVDILPTTKEYGTVEWTYTWNELPTYDEEGKEIKYTVDETGLNYTKGEQTVENKYYCEKEESVIDGKTIVTLTNIKYGTITVTKVDSRNEELKLPGAEFKLEKVIKDEETDEWVVPEGEDYIVYTGTTGEYGTYTFEGLKYGYYKLTETQAPENYKIAEEDIEVIEVKEETANVEVTIGNTRMYKLPITGGIGVDTIRNAEILGGIILLIVLTNRKKVVPSRRSVVEAKRISKLKKLAKKHNNK